MFLFLCGFLPFNCCEQCLDAAGLVLPQAENLGCDTHVAPWQHVPQDVPFLRGKRPIELSYSGHSYRAVAASTTSAVIAFKLCTASLGQEVASWGRLQEVIGSDSSLGIGAPYLHRLDGLAESAFLDNPKAGFIKRIAGVQNSERKLPICNDHHHRKGEQEEPDVASDVSLRHEYRSILRNVQVVRSRSSDSGSLLGRDDAQLRPKHR